MMNKVSIYGGLGNQMFQYTLGLALNHRGNKTRIRFSNYLHETHHNGFNLGVAFQLKLPLGQQLLKLLILHGGFLYKNRFAFRLSQKLNQYDHIRALRTYRERTEFQYDDNLFHQQSSLFVGTWQVESYFKDIKDIVQRSFVFKTPKDDTNKKLMKGITSSNSVAIHIRRGDYLATRWASTHAVIKDSTYYLNAINYINARVENPHYFIFSDDVQWARENLTIGNITYVDHNKGSLSYIDMYLMSLCKHNIIANSTFSWWGAWLNKNDNKIVIMPEKWLNTHDCPGIFPSEWVKMKV